MTLILGLDFETNGVDFAESRIIEIGAVLWHVEQKKPLAMLSELVRHDPMPEISPEITQLTGIARGDLEDHGTAPNVAFSLLYMLAEKASYIVAHNGKEFDRPMLEAEVKRLEFPLWEQPWLDTLCDIPYPDSVGTRKLGYLAAEHGFLNPFAHRALFDVLTTLTIFGCYDFDEVVRYAAEPSIKLTIHVQPPWEDGGKSNGKAKELGYRYDGKTKKWQKTVKQSQVEKETSAASPYKVTQSA